jgi:hypothetical protein
MPRYQTSQTLWARAKAPEFDPLDLRQGNVDYRRALAANTGRYQQFVAAMLDGAHGGGYCLHPPGKRFLDGIFIQR